MRSFFIEKCWYYAIPPFFFLNLRSVRKWVGSVLTLGLTFNFTRVKGRHPSQSELYILKKLSLLKNVIVKLELL